MPILVPHASLAALLGQASVSSNAHTVGELLAEVEARVTPEAWAKAMRCIILVNGRSVHLLQGFDTPLKPDDQVWMVFPAAGG